MRNQDSVPMPFIISLALRFKHGKRSLAVLTAGVSKDMPEDVYPRQCSVCLCSSNREQKRKLT